jgi:uncharacterized protein YbjT (DUF2867 family)
MKYAVLGATGQTGGATARALLADGEAVRVVVRRPEVVSAWQAAGADVALADLDDADSMTRAFVGVDAAFIATPPELDAADPFAENRIAIATLTAAIRGAGLPYAVYLSSIGAQHTHGLGAIGKLHDMEQAFAELPVPTVALRAGWFMENARGLIAGARETGELPSMLDPLELAVPMISTEDIGAVAAELLRRAPRGSYAVELAQDAHSSNDVARSMTELLRRPVRAQVVPRSERPAIYASWGMSPVGAQAMSDMIDGFNRGWIRFEGGSVEQLRGTTPLDAALARMAREGAATAH